MDYLKDYNEAQATGAHHVDCDGWRMSHRVNVTRTSFGTFECKCDECDWTPPGSFGSESTARSIARSHEAGEILCDFRCKHWD